MPTSSKVLVLGRQRCVHLRRSKECVMLSVEEARAIEKRLEKQKKKMTQRGGDGDTLVDQQRRSKTNKTNKMRSKNALQEEEARRTGDVFTF